MDKNDFDFSSAVAVQETDSGEAVSTTKFDFSTAENVEEPQAPVKSPRTSIISEAANFMLNKLPATSQADQIKAAFDIIPHLPSFNPNESIIDYGERVGPIYQSLFKERERKKVEAGIGAVLETPLQMGLAVGAITNLPETVVSIGAYSILDHFFNLRRFTETNFPNTAPEVKDMIEIADFALKGGLIGKGVFEGRKFLKSTMEVLGIPRNANISSDVIQNVKDSGNLLPEEKTDLLKTLGIEDKHVDASISGNSPINVPTDKLIELADKPYWEIAKHELLGGTKEELAKDLFGEPIQPLPRKASQELLQNLKNLQQEKELSGATFKKLKDFVGVENIKKAPEPLIKKLISFVEDLDPKDKFLSTKQVSDLGSIIKDFPNPDVTPKRIVLEKFGEKEDILNKGLGKVIMPELAPTIDIKEGHPLVKKIVEGVSERMIKAEDIINERNKELDKIVTAAEKSRAKLLPLDEKLRRKAYPQNKEIFQALSGEKINLTSEESSAVSYLKSFFAEAKTDLALEKYRKNYITHLEQPFMEKIITKGLFGAIKDIFRDTKQTDLPVDIQLELDNIIGSEKFFKFALERKGGIEPSTNIRNIVNQYSHLLESKKALDQILPEGQAVTKNLLQGKSAVWMKRYLQNLKGRGLDNNFRNGPMGWLAKTADAIIDIGYLKMLGLNWKSAVKNIVAGEANSWIYQDFKTYLKGKERLFSNPKRAYDLATRYGALEGTYSDFAQKGIGALKKYQDLAMVGQKIGEIEIRSSIFASELTPEEWASGEIAPERFSHIKDVIAKTQGIFSKWDSPLLLQTWYGRMFFQMNRWRITNISLMADIIAGSYKDIKAGEWKTRNVTRLGKALTAYGVGMYISYQFAQAGYKTASQISRNMAQTIDGVVTLFTEGEFAKMFTDNPSLHTLKEFSNSIQNLAAYIHIPGARKTKEKGIEDTYIAPVETAKDVIGALEN